MEAKVEGAKIYTVVPWDTCFSINSQKYTVVIIPFKFDVCLLLRMIWGYLFQERSILAMRGPPPITQHLETHFKCIQKTVGLFLHSVSRSWEHSMSLWNKYLQCLPVTVQNSRENTMSLRTSCEFVTGVKVTNWCLDVTWKCYKKEKCCSPCSCPSQHKWTTSFFRFK